MDLIKVAEEAFATGKQLPEFGPGDTITVAYRIKEGNKERIQQYRGVVIRISGEGTKKRFTVRKMSDNIGVERIFPIERPRSHMLRGRFHGSPIAGTVRKIFTAQKKSGSTAATDIASNITTFRPRRALRTSLRLLTHSFITSEKLKRKT